MKAGYRDESPVKTPKARPPKGLAYISDQSRGFKRRKAGKQFVFFDQNNERILDDAVVARIRKLAIPPAYRDVWICPKPNGHLQATGIDARGRKQYRYHPQWRAVRDAAKFDRLSAFAEALSHIRRTVDAHTALRGLSREKVLATVVKLLEKTLIRVGNDEYARSNRSYGLTTLKAQHVNVSGQTIGFMFKGKSGKSWQIRLSDRRLAAIIRACSAIEGRELFKYKDSHGRVHDVTSNDVNRYLHDLTGTKADMSAFTAKDFRTWAGTVGLAEDLRENAPPATESEAKKVIAAAIGRVSAQLGNTPAICRKCYVHPFIISAYQDGSLNQAMKRAVPQTLRHKYPDLSDVEINVLCLLKQDTISGGG